MWKPNSSNFMHFSKDDIYCREVYYVWCDKSKSITPILEEVNIYQHNQHDTENSVRIFTIDIYAPLDALQRFFTMLKELQFPGVELQSEPRLTFSGSVAAAMHFINHASNFDTSLQIGGASQKMIRELFQAATMRVDTTPKSDHMNARKTITKPTRLSTSVKKLLINLFTKDESLDETASISSSNAYSHVSSTKYSKKD